MAASIKTLAFCRQLIKAQNMSRCLAIPRTFHSCVRLLAPAHDAEFNAAKDRLSSLSDDPGNDVKLQMYALFKQASIGKCNAKKPGMMDFVGGAKWNAWNDLGDLSQDDAQKKYIDIVADLVKNDSSAKASPTPSESSEGQFSTILVDNKEGLYTITLNRPSKKNAINLDMYREIGEALQMAANDDSVVVAVFTGAGDYYCSGNDLTNFMNIAPSEIAKMAVDGGVILKEFVGTFIDFPKPLIALVNGPSVGVSCTVLGLFDLVYASDQASFNTPFSALGQTPEGCSSYLFPKIMGNSKANEMLLFNRKLTAQEACDRGLVTEVFPQHAFNTEAWTKVRSFAKLPKQTLRLSKNLIRSAERDALHATNDRECEQLVERWQSDECINAIMAFFSRKG